MSAPTQEDITKAVEAKDRGIAYSNYADTIIMEPVLIAGTRYKYNLCEHNMYSEVENNGG